MTDKLKTVPEVDALLGQAQTVRAIHKARGNTIGLAKVDRHIDNLLDRRNVITGPPVCGCGRVKSRFGGQVHLCMDCDFLICEDATCERRVLALDSLVCNPHRGVTASPWPPESNR